jgi:long-subunit fatty acid transport protein
MKAKEIKVGGKYLARVSGRFTTVRVDAIETERPIGYGYGRTIRYGTRYRVTNLLTNRQLTFRSAAKFRRAVSDTIYAKIRLPDGTSVIEVVARGTKVGDTRNGGRVISTQATLEEHRRNLR